MMILRLKEHQALQRNLKVPRVQKGVRNVAKIAPDDLTIDHVWLMFLYYKCICHVLYVESKWT